MASHTYYHDKAPQAGHQCWQSACVLIYTAINDLDASLAHQSASSFSAGLGPFVLVLTFSELNIVAAQGEVTYNLGNIEGLMKQH